MLRVLKIVRLRPLNVHLRIDTISHQAIRQNIRNSKMVYSKTLNLRVSTGFDMK